MKSIGIYVHIPFCIKKCNYCNFNSWEPADSRQIKQYIKSLLQDIKLSSELGQNREISSVYIGGGTPSFIRAEYIQEIITRIKQCFKLAANHELAIEANPGSLSKQKILIYKQAGINRVSVGVQSFKNKYLKLLGRSHNSQQALQSLEMLKANGFDNISADLIYGLPGQSLADWQDDLQAAVESEISHISLYDLIIEENTPFYDMRNDLMIGDNDLQTLMYKKAHNFLASNKFKHYEISSFAKKGRQSKHNLIYWSNSEYIGIGAGAYSYIQKERFSKPSDLKQYQQQVKRGSFEHCGSEILSSRKLIEETLILKLRILNGFCLKDIENALGQAVPQDIIQVLNEFVGQGFILLQNNLYKLSKKGLLHYDTIASELLS
ncbi:MAG: radical SAM family heme chaperone HemW [Candidatus Omnitrophica bacterium]|nr:radical SAM family heme chaperone HemW [Candidatus Omnitrophota bacterium]